jgi:alanyl-tRNA synthetase
MGKRVETTDSWVGEDGYIGYRGNPPSTEQLRAAEEMENQMIAKGAKVLSQLVTREEALQLAPDAPNLARLPNGTHLRVITIEGCHGIPCGGTHLKDIGEIGKFKLNGTESSPEGFRVKFDVPS